MFNLQYLFISILFSLFGACLIYSVIRDVSDWDYWVRDISVWKIINYGLLLTGGLFFMLGGILGLIL